MTENQIVQTALENMKKTANIEADWYRLDQKGIDGKIDILINNQHQVFYVEVKNQLTQHNLQTIEDLHRKYASFVVIATRIFPAVKEKLREEGINYIEANGNFCIRKKNTFYWVDVNKPLQTEKATGNRAFSKTGLRVVFQFLLDEEWVNKPYRELAELADTSVGNINYIIQNLKEKGYLIAMKSNQYQLQNKKELLSDWLDAFHAKLEPSLWIGRFRFAKLEHELNWKKLKLSKGKTWWGGEPAADLLSNYIRPKDFTLYTTESKNDLVKNYRLIPDEKGYITAYSKFWTNHTTTTTAPPLVVYADLMNADDRRSQETARKIFDEYLQDKL